MTYIVLTYAIRIILEQKVEGIIESLIVGYLITLWQNRKSSISSLDPDGIYYPKFTLPKELYPTKFIPPQKHGS